jgi:ribonuclease PH
MNFVVTGKGGFVEIQGTAEKQSFSQQDMLAMTEGALKAIERIKAKQLQLLKL